MGGGSSGSSETRTLVQGPTPEAAQQAGAFQVQAAKEAADAARENTRLAIDYLRENSQQGLLFNQLQTGKGLQAIDSATYSTISSINSMVDAAVQTIKGNFANAKETFTPFTQTGLTALDELSAMLGLSGKPSKYAELGRIEAGKANVPIQPVAPERERYPLEPTMGFRKDYPAQKPVKVTDDEIRNEMAKYIGTYTATTQRGIPWSYTAYTGPGADPSLGAQNIAAHERGQLPGGVMLLNGSPNIPGSALGVNGVFANASIRDALGRQIEARKLEEANERYGEKLEDIDEYNRFITQLYEQDKKLYDYQVEGINDRYSKALKDYEPILNEYNSQLGKYQTYYVVQNPETGNTPYIDDRNRLQQEANTPALTGEEIYAKLAATPGYQFQLGEGLKSITHNRAAKGLLHSGALLKDLEAYGQGLASQTYGQRLSELSNLVGLGYNAASAQASLDQNQGLGISSLLANKGTSLANAYGNQGTSLANLYGNLGQSTLSAYQNMGGGLAGLQTNLGDSLANAALAAGQARASAHLAANQQVKSYVTGSSSYSSSPGFGGVLGGIGSVLGAFK